MNLQEISEQALEMERDLLARPSSQPPTNKELARLAMLVREAAENVIRAAQLLKGNTE